MLEHAKLLPLRKTAMNEVNLQQLHHFLREIQLQCPLPEDIVFICIGTDQSTGDSFGPLVGSQLQSAGFPNVIGTLAFPCDADRVQHEIKTLQHQDKLVVAIDAGLGTANQIGSFIYSTEPLKPGSALGKTLSSIGSYSICAVVNCTGPKAYWKLQSTSLFQVMELATALASQISKVWNMNKECSLYDSYIK